MAAKRRNGEVDEGLCAAGKVLARDIRQRRQQALIMTTG
jgi:hypothetical protein